MRQIEDPVRLRRRAANPGVLARHIGGSSVCTSSPLRVRPGHRVAGTGSSNPFPSSGESGANLSLAGIRLSTSRSRGHYLRSHWLANSVFPSLADIMDACETAWNRFAADHALIRSLCAVAWAADSPAQ
jgi:hypothetical protein